MDHVSTEEESMVFVYSKKAVHIGHAVYLNTSGVQYTAYFHSDNWRDHYKWDDAVVVAKEGKYAGIIRESEMFNLRMLSPFRKENV